MHTEPEAKGHTPVWRDPLSAGFRAHRHLLLLRLRWHEHRIADGRQDGVPNGDGSANPAAVLPA
ncbi:hypothetical protein [Mycolicibacterium moriokaense]|uniref:hypothetical protein n=1 Tax=Mycolicibacterium moriokaense TaxID=39691 RepID=UPI0011B47B4C|nr:hypothetical protein [Mycolicibacterium moriokaense]